MIRDEPFPPPVNHLPTLAWACDTLTQWHLAGYPVLIGPPAEQVHLARQILGLTESSLQE